MKKGLQQNLWVKAGFEYASGRRARVAGNRVVIARCGTPSTRPDLGHASLHRRLDAFGGFAGPVGTRRLSPAGATALPGGRGEEEAFCGGVR